MGYTSYLSMAHMFHTVKWCESTGDRWYLVCDVEHSYSSKDEVNRSFCSDDPALLRKAREQVGLYERGELGRRGDGASFGSCAHDGHNDYWVTLRI